MGSKKRARTCATASKKRQRSAQAPAQEPTFPELPCVLWHKIFRDAADADKSVDNLARLRLVHKATARDLEFKLFAQKISEVFDGAVQKRKEAYEQWLVDNRDTGTPSERHSATYGQIGAMRGHNAGGILTQLLIYELFEESGALGDVWGKRRGRPARARQPGGMARACIRAAQRAFSEARTHIRGY